MNKYKTTFNTWNKIAQIYQDKFMDLDLYNKTYDLFCSLITQNHPEILEIGCGPGNITKYILTKRPDFNIIATDISENMIALAKENNPTAKFNLLDARKINTIQDNFDAILCGFCMPYLSKEDCSKLIKDSVSLLKNNGLIYFSTIEGDYKKSGYGFGSTIKDKTYVYYHQENYLKAQLLENNFEIIKIFRIQYSKNNHQNDVHLVFIAKKI